MPSSNHVDWNAARYHTLSEPQVAWGRTVMQRLAPRAGESILDLGCGTGRLTRELQEMARGGRVVGLDRSDAMLTEARHAADGAHGVCFVRADGAALPFVTAFDAVFSTAALHWMPDHDAVFTSVHQALLPGGRFVAQCGGGPNLRTLYERAAALLVSPPFAHYAQGWQPPWLFADVETTERRLEQAGFTAIDVSLECRPTTMAGREVYAEFIELICLKPHVARLPPAARSAFVGEITDQAEADVPPFTLDYWRLNVAATKPAQSVART